MARKRAGSLRVLRLIDACFFFFFSICCCTVVLKLWSPTTVKHVAKASIRSCTSPADDDDDDEEEKDDDDAAADAALLLRLLRPSTASPLPPAAPA